MNAFSNVFETKEYKKAENKLRKEIGKHDFGIMIKRDDVEIKIEYKSKSIPAYYLEGGYRQLAKLTIPTKKEKVLVIDHYSYNENAGPLADSFAEFVKSLAPLFGAKVIIKVEKSYLGGDDPFVELKGFSKYEAIALKMKGKNASAEDAAKEVNWFYPFGFHAEGSLIYEVEEGIIERTNDFLKDMDTLASELKERDPASEVQISGYAKFPFFDFPFYYQGYQGELRFRCDDQKMNLDLFKEKSTSWLTFSKTKEEMELEPFNIGDARSNVESILEYCEEKMRFVNELNPPQKNFDEFMTLHLNNSFKEMTDEIFRVLADKYGPKEIERDIKTKKMNVVKNESYSGWYIELMKTYFVVDFTHETKGSNTSYSFDSIYTFESPEEAKQKFKEVMMKFEMDRRAKEEERMKGILDSLKS